MKTSSNYVIVYDFETGNLWNSKCIAFDNAPLVELAMVCVDMNKLEIIDEVDLIFPYGYKEDLVFAFHKQCTFLLFRFGSVMRQSVHLSCLFGCPQTSAQTWLHHQYV